MSRKLREVISLDVVWVAALLVWFGASIWFGWTKNGDVFPRLGACLVAIVAIYYSLLPDLHPQPFGYAQSNLWTSKIMTENSRNIHSNTQRIAVLAKDFAIVLRQQDITPPVNISFIADQAKDDVDMQHANSTFDEQLRLAGGSAEQTEAANEAVLNAALLIRCHIPDGSMAVS